MQTFWIKKGPNRSQNDIQGHKKLKTTSKHWKAGVMSEPDYTVVSHGKHCKTVAVWLGLGTITSQLIFGKDHGLGWDEKSMLVMWELYYVLLFESVYCLPTIWNSSEHKVLCHGDISFCEMIIKCWVNPMPLRTWAVISKVSILCLFVPTPPPSSSSWLRPFHSYCSIIWFPFLLPS